jgi:flagellar protein FlgJ
MRQADFAIAAMRATAPTASTRPSAPAGGAGAGFDGLMRDVQAEVGDFIDNGGADAMAPAPALSVEGGALRALSADAAATAYPGAAAGADDPAGAAYRAGAASVDGAERRQFLDGIEPWARQAAERLGVAPHLVAAHAALESGWGRHPLRQRDGADSNNLFALKAGGRWQGAALDAATTEYRHGAALPATERFRSYADPGAAFDDYATLLLENPRYHAALNTGADAQAFAQGLARGGYASDPAYADKLARLARQLAPAAPGAAGLPSTKGAY